jgi:hypothetical protein
MKERAAQVVAAADAIERCMFAPHELPLPVDLHLKYLHTASEALIAAEASARTRRKEGL